MAEAVAARTAIAQAVASDGATLRLRQEQVALDTKALLTRDQVARPRTHLARRRDFDADEVFADA